ncbi:disease resistance protein RGA2-like [Zingiber officinale]|uniref:disease resistance protein RGA2-like n=1 Tax=Zingiber officinale TaxID=94328 RepID=UPI001C4DB152|nr:disease resistance protein RGA2-like [Zingiber officinale]
MDPHIIVLTVIGWIVPAVVTMAINKTLNNPPKDDKAKKLEEEIEKKSRIIAQLDEEITSNQIVKHGLWGVKNVVGGAKEAIENYRKHDGRCRKVFFWKPDARTNWLEEAHGMLDQTDVDFRAVAVARQNDEEYKFRRTTGERKHFTKLRGRDAETRALLNWLENSQRSFSSGSKKFSILSVVGPGGIGKTELAREAYNARASFGIKAWVSVCKNCDVKKMTIEIMDSADIKLPPGLHSINSPEQIRSIFTKRIKGQRVLVVFDDVWEGFSTSWEELYASLSHGKQGSRVIVTTQLERVAKLIGSDETINLDPLEHQEYWKLFEECAFGNQNPNNYPELQQLGQAIAAKFEGSPLAAVEIGRRLASNLTKRHWEKIAGSQFGELQRSRGDILSALEFCYEQLPTRLKQCYLSCALFPKNYCFDKDQLLRMWVALGFAPSLADEEIRSLAEDLASRSFFVNAERRNNKFMIHPVYHELADMICDGEFFRLEEETEETKIPEKARHVYVKADILVKVCKGLGEKENLYSLVIDGSLSSGIPNSKSDFHNSLNKVLDDLKGLRVLILPELPGNGSLRSIQKLSHLEYLEIPSNENRTLSKSFLARYRRGQVKLNQVSRDLFIKREGMDELAKLYGVTADWQPEAISTASLGRRRRKRSLPRAARKDQLLWEQ